MSVRFQADADLAGVREQELLAQTVREVARTHRCPTQVTPRVMDEIGVRADARGLTPAILETLLGDE